MQPHCECCPRTRDELVDIRKQLEITMATVKRLTAAANRCVGRAPESHVLELPMVPQVISSPVDSVCSSGSTGSVKTRPLDCEWRVNARSKRPVQGRQGLERAQGVIPIPLTNRFEGLSLNETEAEPLGLTSPVGQPALSCVKRKQSRKGRGLLIVGSSNVRRIMVPLREMAAGDRKEHQVHSVCMPGGLVQHVEEAIPAAIEGTGCSQLQIVAHVGTNDACRLGSEVILGSFQRLAEKVEKTSLAHGVSAKLTICSIVPRTDRGPLVLSRVEGLNQRLRGFCDKLGCDFLDLRHRVENCRIPLNGSGVHYTSEAATQVADCVWSAHKGFLD